MIDYLMYALYIILSIAPFSVVRFYPFTNQLRVKPNLFWGIYSCLVALEVIWFISIQQGTFVLGVTDNELLRLVFYPIYLLISLIFIKEKPSKHLIVWSVCIIYSSTFTAFTFGIDTLFPSPIPFLVKNICMIVFLPFFLWFSFVFVNQHIMPLINQSNQKTNRMISTLLILIIAMELITVRELPARTATPWAIFGIRVVASAITLVVCYIFSAIIQEQTEYRKIMEENKQNEKMLAVSTQQFIALSDKIEETRRAQHDLKFHIAAIKAFANKQDYASILNYLKGDSLLPTNQVLSFCNHPTANIIFSYYRDIAAEHNIQFKVATNVSSSIFLSDNELWVLLGNLLENAIEATKQIDRPDKLIQVKMHANAAALVLTVDNPFKEQNLTRSGQSFISNKEKGGVGLKSVSFLAKKYNGLAMFETKNDWFLASVTMYR